MYRCTYSISLLLVLLFVFVGFFIVTTQSPDHPDIVAENTLNFSKGGKLVGTLPDGREVRVYFVNRGTSNDHFVYVIGGMKTTSTNYNYQNGKQSVNTTIVVAEEP